MEGRPTPLDGYGPTDAPDHLERAADFERIGGFEVIAQTAREILTKSRWTTAKIA